MSDGGDNPGAAAPGAISFNTTVRDRLAVTDVSTRIRSRDGAEIAKGQSWLEIFLLVASPTTAHFERHARGYGAETEMQLAKYRNEDDPAMAAALGGDLVIPPKPSDYLVVLCGRTGAMEPLSAGHVAAAVARGAIRGAVTTDEAPGNPEFSGYVEVRCSILKSDDTHQGDPKLSPDVCKPYAYLAGTARPPVTSPTKTE